MIAISFCVGELGAKAIGRDRPRGRFRLTAAPAVRSWRSQRLRTCHSADLNLDSLALMRYSRPKFSRSSYFTLQRSQRARFVAKIGGPAFSTSSTDHFFPNNAVRVRL